MIVCIRIVFDSVPGQSSLMKQVCVNSLHSCYHGRYDHHLLSLAIFKGQNLRSEVIERQ